MKQQSAASDREAAKKAAEMRKMTLQAIAAMNMDRVRNMKASEFSAMSAKQASE